ncbi:MAG: preprotein translocase subunit SecE [Candidatus Zambryskibacteria bacterium RIFCSPLOWO2_02_FULL_51_21]|uniref:Protein translocase subunit SecE n=1 Tax=Candidatus Zambryskibacteria bacterium RIFCSPHIGHO2_02_FULL_43_37 TaxID=1802749 RepID=A0A1G2TGA2_9BACT|nr:MAG: preprotein translocase subunit SecE [Candidatus Zambryskibacteria bacterium RIFCSPHIGHO2_01_FULL_52_18]OHA96310.1 MAG: preprotein translocase subunit SecE [Candidatus Zambryskibacteria bacterium RIFCSPHIGHO2_02_FULL_43_37]OHB07713.1 MAG: preprotein translocase subunit SecE [Candidatus Zambryskibacteria bacterium RIFCSPLOWO2_01_FULL_52_12]OHB11431.1 MAG: preprotein translocase subunit SecE [Candidatus Zambryskibacteria bacterium RIFCSPLOWO2_02_FULL_51_21]
MNRFLNYVRDTRGELAHVSWPTRKQAMVFTAIVIVVSILTALYLGLFDYILSLILQKFIL